VTEKRIVCISCPIGCRLTVVSDDELEITVNGNLCDRGAVYGREEFSSPKRIVTSVVKTNSTEVPYVPIKTDRPIPRKLISGLLHELRRTEVSVPVKRGDVLISDYAATGVNIVYSRTVKD
jgi:CxxC motif-containing protein